MKKYQVLLGFLILLIPTLSCALMSGIQNGSPSSTDNKSSQTLLISEISAGGSHACALLKSGEVMCWGDNTSGQLGDGTYTPSTSAVKVEGLEKVVAISSGSSHTCAVLEGGGVKCWGDNADGKLGDGTKIMKNLPSDVIELGGEVISISAGLDHTCVVLASGNIQCWGKNFFGVLGNVSNDRWSSVPVDVVGINGQARSVVTGNEHTCALLKSGVVKCWGRNTSGELGTGGSRNGSKTPIEVQGLSNNVSMIITGFAKTCALIEDGQLACWGWISMDLMADTPFVFKGLDNVTDVAAGAGHICVVIRNGDVYCFGENGDGQLGDGGTSDSKTLVKVKGLPANAISVVASYDTTCALLENASVYCWGRNSTGQLGNGSLENSTVPVEVVGLSPGN